MTGHAVIREEAPGGVSFFREALRRVWAGGVSRGCLAVLAVFALAALWGEAANAWYAWRDVTPPWQAQELAARYLAPGAEHWLGTDGLGRDVFLRLVQGARIAFLTGVVSSLIAIPIGVLLGCLGGYFGGKTDDVVVWLSTTFAAIPGLLFVLAIAMVVGKGLLGVFLAIGLTTWVGVCRLIRAEVIQQKSRGYVRAARALGFSHGRILFRHILPNAIGPIIVQTSLSLAFAILAEAALSFFGLGTQPPDPSWGRMLSEGRAYLRQAPWMGIFPGLAIMVSVLGFNLLGDGLRDAFDPRDQAG